MSMQTVTNLFLTLILVLILLKLPRTANSSPAPAEDSVRALGGYFWLGRRLLQ